MNDSAMRGARESDLANADAKPPAAPPCAVVIFGAGGDLTKRLLVPALYNLARVGILPPKFRLIGVDHRERTIDDFRAGLRESVQQFAKTRGAEAGEFDATAWARIENAVDYVQADFNDPAGYKRLSDHMATVDRDHGTLGNIVFYLAVASRFFGPITLALAMNHLMADDFVGKSKVMGTADAPFLASEKGMTLYTFEKDVGGKATCTATCAEQFPPVLVIDGDMAVMPFSFVTREDGKRQWAIGDHPLYFNAKDAAPGDINGKDVEGWKLVAVAAHEM